LKIVDINIVENEQHEIGFKKELLDFERQWVKSYPIARNLHIQLVCQFFVMNITAA